MGRFLAVNGALFVLGVLILLPLAFSTVSRCSRYLWRTIRDLFTAPGRQAAQRKVFLERKAPEASSLRGKSILMVDEEPALLEFLETEIRHAFPSLRIQTAATYGEATTLLGSWTYDLVLFDITGTQGFDILTQAVNRPYPIPALMLNAEALPPASLERALALGGHRCLSRENVRQIVPFVDGMMKGNHEALWRRMLHPVRRQPGLPFRFAEGRYFGAAIR